MIYSTCHLDGLSQVTGVRVIAVVLILTQISLMAHNISLTVANNNEFYKLSRTWGKNTTFRGILFSDLFHCRHESALV